MPRVHHVVYVRQDDGTWKANSAWNRKHNAERRERRLAQQGKLAIVNTYPREQAIPVQIGDDIHA